MEKIKLVDLTGHGRTAKKVEGINGEIFLTYAFAILTIAGADGDVSEAEMTYLIRKVRSLGATDELVQRVKEFDWRNADLNDLLDRLHAAKLGGNCSRALLYDAIKVARADGEYHTDEQRAVLAAAERLGLDIEIAKAVNSIIEIEASAGTVLRALLRDN